jgi:hypothetical protein
MVVQKHFFLTLLLKNQNTLFTQEVVRTHSITFLAWGSWTTGN